MNRQFNAAGLMIAVRILSMLFGLAGVPILLTILGHTQFSAWAVLLGGSLAFYTLEFGMAPTVVKFISDDEQHSNNAHVSVVMSNAMMIVAVVYSLVSIALFIGVAPLATWLNLPATPLFSPSGLIFLVFIAVSACVFLRIGVNTLYAAERFDMIAIIALVQSVFPNLFAWLVAYETQRLDWVLLVYWITQIVILLGAHIIARRIVWWRFDRTHLDRKLLRTLFAHGRNVQISELSHFVHFQFDKMLIAGFVGLPMVANYEVASRAGQALRSLPITGLSVFLPAITQQHQRGEGLWPSYLAMTRFAAHMAVVFILLPLTIAPMFLFAWTGLIGFHGTGVFSLLAIGIFISVLLLPVSTFAQAINRTDLEAKAALGSLLLNALLSLFLIRNWGMAGAAVGTAIAMIWVGIVYLWVFHRLQQQRLWHTVKHVLHSIWPAIPISIIWLILSMAVMPQVIHSRWAMGPAAVLLYCSGVVALLVAYRYCGCLGQVEQQWLAKLPVVGRWLAPSQRLAKA